MTEAMLDKLLCTLRQRIMTLAQTGAPWQVELHGKGASVQVKVTEIANLTDGVRLEERVSR